MIRISPVRVITAAGEQLGVLPIEEALEFFTHIPKIRRRLQALHDVGLDYIRLGQPATTLSGGEAQRVKLASELCKVATGATLYLLDEPTTGLHFADIQRLLEVLRRLVSNGNSVVVIEHNLDVIKTADRLIDMGPEGGEEGGHIVVTGTPEQVAAVEGSHTGEFLRGLVKPAAPPRKRAPRRRKVPAAAYCQNVQVVQPPGRVAGPPVGPAGAAIQSGSALKPAALPVQVRHQPAVV